jgi:hypothetical protein
MSSIGRVGFFHFGSDEKEDPVGALTSAIEKWFREQRSNPIGAIPELTDTLLVLPEGFNVLNGYYAPKPELDANACFRLKALSTTRGITFVVGLIEKLKGQNSAYLIDGNTAPQLLSRKRTIGAGTLDLYAPCQTFEEEAVLHRGIGITALLCDDAGLSGERRPELTKFRRLQCGSKVLCVPACMMNTDSLGRARRWADSITVVMANGCRYCQSVIIHGDKTVVSTEYGAENEIMLLDLSVPGKASCD